MPRIAGAKSTEFSLYAPQAKKVALAGNFNNWDAKALSAKKDSKGNWSVKVSLKPGRYEYKFVVDGSWMTDPRNGATISTPLGSQNSVLVVK